MRTPARGPAMDPLTHRLLAALDNNPTVRAELQAALRPPVDPTVPQPFQGTPEPFVRPEDQERAIVAAARAQARETEKKAAQWVDVVFPRRLRGVAYIPKAQLDWALAVAVCQVLYDRGGDLYLLDAAGNRQVVIDTDIRVAWACSLDAWSSKTNFAVHLADARAADHYVFVL